MAEACEKLKPASLECADLSALLFGVQASAKKSGDKSPHSKVFACKYFYLRPAV